MSALGQALTEGFESGTFPPTGWVSYDNGIGAAQFWQPSATAYAGANSAFVRYENVTGIAEDWLVTPQVALTGGNTSLVFYQRQAFGTDYGTTYTIRVSTVDQTTMANFTIVDTQVEADFSTAWTAHVVDLSAYAGQSVWVAFVMEQDDGDNWYIDNVEITTPPCLVTGLAANNLTSSSADIVFNAPSSDVDVEYGLTGFTPTGFGQVTGTGSPVTLNGLAPNTTYDAYVQAYCDGPARMMISGVWDGPLPGGQPKGAELYVMANIPDLSRYGISSANNGGGTTAPNPEFVFPADQVAAGSYIYVTSDSAAFRDFFGFNANYVSNSMLINGDDAVELFQDSVVFDVFGDVNVDGTGQSWEYLDGWAYRKPNQAPNGGVFTDTLWNYSGINQLEGGLVNDSTNSPFPIGTYTTTFDSSVWVGPVTFTTLCNNTVGNGIVDAIPVTGVVYTDSGSTDSCFTSFYGNPAADVVYQVIVEPCTDSLTASLCGSGYDSFLALLDAGGNLIDDNDDFCGLQSEVSIAVSGGDTIYVVVDGYNDNTGDYLLTITQNLTPFAATIAYPADTFCVGGMNPMASIVGDSGGVFMEMTGNLVVNPATGMIDLAASSAGTYEVIYTVGAGQCAGADTAMVVLTPQEDAMFSYALNNLCEDGGMEMVDSLATPGGMFAASPAGLSIDPVTGAIDPGASALGAYDVSYMTAGACPDTFTVSVSVNTEDDASFGYADTIFCQLDSIQLPTVTGLAGGTFDAVAAFVIDPATGAFDPSVSMPGVYEVIYTTNGPCPASDTFMVTIDVCFSVDPGQVYEPFALYPVPNQGQFFLENHGAAGDVKLVVADLAGRRFHEATRFFAAGEKVEIDLGDIPAGSYFVQLITEEGVQSLRMVVVE